MARPRNPERRAELLVAAIDVVQRLGIAGVTLRPLANEIGVAPRTLLYHFGSKEKLLVEVIRDLRRHHAQIAQSLTRVHWEDEPERQLGETVDRLWQEAKLPGARPFLALYFELVSLAIRDPDQYRPLLVDADREWVDAITGYLTRCGIHEEETTAMADTLLIGYRGAVSFALATGRWESAEASIATAVVEVQDRIRDCLAAARRRN